MNRLSGTDIYLILESLKYTKLKFESTPIGTQGFQSYEFKRQKINEIEELIEKIRNLQSA